MPTFAVTIHHFRKPGVLNTEEPVVLKSLHSLGFAEIENIQMGWRFVLTIKSVLNKEDARVIARAACDKLLVNLVTNVYEIEKIEEVMS